MIGGQYESIRRKAAQSRESAVNLLGLITRALFRRDTPPELRDKARADELATEAVNNIRAEFDSTTLNELTQQIEPLLVNLNRLSATDPPCFTPSSDKVMHLLKSPFWGLRNVENLAHMPKHLHPFFFAFASTYAARRLYVTDNNRLGLGPASLELGDSVCILPGSDVDGGSPT
jgi:hypothetical protein